MALYRVLAEQKITKKVLVIVEANSDREAFDKVNDGEIVAIESALGTKIDRLIPIKTQLY